MKYALLSFGFALRSAPHPLAVSSAIFFVSFANSLAILFSAPTQLILPLAVLLLALSGVLALFFPIAGPSFITFIPGVAVRI